MSNDYIYINLGFHYKGYKCNSGDYESDKILAKADFAVEKSLSVLKNCGECVNWVHAYAWFDGSLYKWVLFNSPVDIERFINILNNSLAAFSFATVKVSEYSVIDEYSKPYKYSLSKKKDYLTIKEYFGVENDEI